MLRRISHVLVHGLGLGISANPMQCDCCTKISAMSRAADRLGVRISTVAGADSGCDGKGLCIALILRGLALVFYETRLSVSEFPSCGFGAVARPLAP